MAMTMATIQSDGRKIAASAMASSRAGKAIIRSVARMMIVPVQPRRYPARMPSVVPVMTATPFAAMPMMREVRAP